MKKFLWFLALLALGFFLARMLRKSQTVVAPKPPAFSEGGAGTSVDWDTRKAKDL
jgi:hypothetical protein